MEIKTPVAPNMSGVTVSIGLGLDTLDVDETPETALAIDDSRFAADV